jgi:hypothetical protein
MLNSEEIDDSVKSAPHRAAPRPVMKIGYDRHVGEQPVFLEYIAQTSVFRCDINAASGVKKGLIVDYNTPRVRTCETRDHIDE